MYHVCKEIPRSPAATATFRAIMSWETESGTLGGTDQKVRMRGCHLDPENHIHSDSVLVALRESLPESKLTSGAWPLWHGIDPAFVANATPFTIAEHKKSFASFSRRGWIFSISKSTIRAAGSHRSRIASCALRSQSAADEF